MGETGVMDFGFYVCKAPPPILTQVYDLGWSDLLQL